MSSESSHSSYLDNLEIANIPGSYNSSVGSFMDGATSCSYGSSYMDTHSAPSHGGSFLSMNDIDYMKPAMNSAMNVYYQHRLSFGDMTDASFAAQINANTNFFPNKLYDILGKESTDVVHWNSTGTSFFVKDQATFSNDILPKYFRLRKFSSFQRQLNLYGFRRVAKGPDAGSYFHPAFRRNFPTMLEQIRRRPGKGAKWTHKNLQVSPYHNADIRGGSFSDTSVGSDTVSNAHFLDTGARRHMEYPQVVLGSYFNLQGTPGQRPQQGIINNGISLGLDGKVNLFQPQAAYGHQLGGNVNMNLVNTAAAGYTTMVMPIVPQVPAYTFTSGALYTGNIPGAMTDLHQQQQIQHMQQMQQHQQQQDMGSSTSSHRNVNSMTNTTISSVDNQQQENNPLSFNSTQQTTPDIPSVKLENVMSSLNLDYFSSTRSPSPVKRLSDDKRIP